MEKIITIAYGLGLISNSIYKYQGKYQLTKDKGALVFEATAGAALIFTALSMGSDVLEKSFLSYFVALGISLVMVIFFALVLLKNRGIHSIMQLVIAIIFFVAGLVLLGGIS
jgi:hypothetical protein